MLSDCICIPAIELSPFSVYGGDANRIRLSSTEANLSRGGQGGRWKKVVEALGLSHQELADRLGYDRRGTISDNSRKDRLNERVLRGLANVTANPGDVFRYLDVGGEMPTIRARSPVGARSSEEGIDALVREGAYVAEALIRRAYHLGRQEATSPDEPGNVSVSPGTGAAEWAGQSPSVEVRATSPGEPEDDPDQIGGPDQPPPPERETMGPPPSPPPLPSRGGSMGAMCVDPIAGRACRYCDRGTRPLE